MAERLAQPFVHVFGTHGVERSHEVRHLRARIVAEALAARGTKRTLFYGARRAEELLCVELFEALGVEIVLATEDGSRGARGRVTVPLGSAR